MKKGKVTLIGAGPGDKGLLTMKGYEALKQSDVVVYDRLVSKDILDLSPENAEMINVGKVMNHHNIFILMHIFIVILRKSYIVSSNFDAPFKAPLFSGSLLNILYI